MMAAMLTLVLTGLLFALRTRQSLVLENLALRHQLAVLHRTAPRPRLRPSDRLFWVLLSRLWSGWAEAVAIVQPETIIRWQRTGFRLFWTWKSRRHGPGRPAVAPEIRALIRRMAEANPLWGAPRIHGELHKLGLEMSQATVSKYLVRRRTPPSQTWRTFLANHVGSLVSVDFFTVPTVLFKVLFVFVVLAHDRRRVVHVNVTDAPTCPSPKPHPTRLTTTHALVTSAPRRRSEVAGPTQGQSAASGSRPRHSETVDVGVGPNGAGRIAWGVAGQWRQSGRAMRDQAACRTSR